ncbi:hypothetical protein C8J57DRAFT_1513678 [Mycena rebaudengoi]|nr:hypothetical protein C8J57DRAFT_1513678 [Mycena rebaudengoi]
MNKAVFSLLVFAVSPGLVHSTDPCELASTSFWVSSNVAHACELQVPFNQTRSLAVIDSALKSLSYYSLESWFIHSPNPLIPHDVNIRSLLNDVQNKTSTSGYDTDWDFNIAVTDAYNREQDGHTLYVAACTEAFTYNLPFSISTLADSPFDHTAFPTFLVNYDFPNQNRPGLEAYFESIGVHVRPYDGARILAIDGVDADRYLTELASESSIYKGLVGAYEDIQPRYNRLMSRYSADTSLGLYTQEAGRFSQRAFYPGADLVTVHLQTSSGSVSLSIPWAANFTAGVNTTASFIAKTCLLSDNNAIAARRQERRPSLRKAVTAPDSQDSVRAAAAMTSQSTLQTNYVQPNLVSFGSFVTLDIYQLEDHPNTYFRGISKTLFAGLTALKKAGVKHVVIDISGNRGGYIAAGAIALWSLWPKDLYPGFPAVYRVNDLIKRQSDVAAASNNTDSEYFFGNYRAQDYQMLTSNKQFMDPPVPQTVNGVLDAYSQPFLDDFGNGSETVTRFTSPPFSGMNYVLVSNGICASTASIFSSYLFQKHGVRSAVFGGTPNATASQFDGGVKGSEVTDLSRILFELKSAGLQNETAAPQKLPVNAVLSLNFRNAIPYLSKKDGILEYVWEEGTRKYQFTHEQYNKPQKIWEFVADEFFGKSY